VSLDIKLIEEIIENVAQIVRKASNLWHKFDVFLTIRAIIFNYFLNLIFRGVLYVEFTVVTVDASKTLTH